MMSAAEAEKRGLQPIARVVAHSAFAHEPAWFTTAPVYALKKLHENLGWTPDDVDLYEINEAFSVVSLATNQELGLDPSRVNIHGGAVALGHPIGASGNRILTTLLYALKRQNRSRGIASLCIGGGEAVSLLVERI